MTGSMALAVQGENICRVENRMTLLQMPEMMDHPARRPGLGGGEGKKNRY